MNRLLAGIVVGLVVGVPLGAFVSRQREQQQPKELPTGDAPQVAKLPVEQNPPPSVEARGNPEPKLQMPQVTPTPVVPTKWVPEVGESYTYEVPDEFVLVGLNGKPGYLVPKDLLAFEKMLKYIKARDGKGLSDQVRARRIFSSPQQNLSVKILSVNSNAGYAEVRMQSGNRYDRDEFGLTIDGMSGQEVIVVLSNIKQK